MSFFGWGKAKIETMLKGVTKPTAENRSKKKGKKAPAAFNGHGVHRVNPRIQILLADKERRRQA